MLLVDGLVTPSATPEKLAEQPAPQLSVWVLQLLEEQLPLGALQLPSEQLAVAEPI